MSNSHTLFFIPYFFFKMNDLTITDLKLLWVVGAAERLATLGLIGGNIPLRLTPEAIDTYLEVDNHRNILFESNFEIAQIFKVMARTESEEEIDDEDMNDLIDLIIDFKNNREEIVKYALSHASV